MLRSVGRGRIVELAPHALTTSLLLAVLGGCSFLVNDEPQCSADTDCAGRGFRNARCEESVCVSTLSTGSGADPHWGCLGNVAWDETANEPKLAVHAKFARLFGETPVAGAPAAMCPPLDVECSAPISSGTTDADGWVTLEGHYGFRGYTLVTAPPDYQEMATAILWQNPPLFEETPRAEVQTAHLTSLGEVLAIATLIGAEPQPALGHVFGLAVDCTGEPTSGVSFSSDTVAPETVTYYLVNTVPSNTARNTDPGGFGGFVNLPGDTFITITATHEDHGKIGVVTVLVKPEHVTYVAVGPSPL